MEDPLSILCIHQMPAEWCATCREIKQKKHEQEVNVGIFDNLAKWVQ